MMTTLVRFHIKNALRSRWLVAHFVLYLLITEGLLLASGASDKTLLSLINVVLLLVPLVGLVFGTIHQYNGREFTELLLTQPVRRNVLFGSLMAGVALPLVASFALGVFLPFAWHGGVTWDQGVRIVTLIGLGSVLTTTSVAAAFMVSTGQADRVRGIGTALGLWLIYAVLFDGAVLLMVTTLGRWPIEKALLGVMRLNTVDLSRLILLQVFDAAAMMGYTGAVFTRFFASATGYIVAGTALLTWMVLPILAARRRFLRQDF